jgi:C1A family cysteine protease
VDTLEKTARPVDTYRYICNLLPSKDIERDWTFRDSIEAGVLAAPSASPAWVDLRAAWWKVSDQERTGSCVGWAVADGLVRYHMVKARKISTGQLLSARHIWMASKETDGFTARPETFIEEAGTSLKAAVDVARKQGIALAADLPFHISTTMFLGKEAVFYAGCAQRRITSYFNLGKDTAAWKHWLATTGPVLVGLNVDAAFDSAKANGGNIDAFQPATARGGHAVTLVGYRPDGRFIVRNSWGTDWGDGGFGYVSPAYVAAAFFAESYGVHV